MDVVAFSFLVICVALVEAGLRVEAGNGVSESRTVSTCCQNGGLCVMGAFCHCKKWYYGRRCQFRWRRCGAVAHGYELQNACRRCRCEDGIFVCVPAITEECLNPDGETRMLNMRKTDRRGNPLKNGAKKAAPRHSATSIKRGNSPLEAAKHISTESPSLHKNEPAFRQVVKVIMADIKASRKQSPEQAVTSSAATKKSAILFWLILAKLVTLLS